jgi:8-oxo-dGTP pyrophosphatase MutT (NUDIX family)
MATERAAGLILFIKEKGKANYLLLQYNVNYWGFAKGLIETGEKTEETARRELEEETGIKDIKFIPGFKEEINYFFKREGKTIFKTNIYFLAETKTREVKLSFEHNDYKWASYKEALKKLTYENSKKVLKAAHKFITEHECLVC